QRGVVLEEPLGQAHAPHVDRHHALDVLVADDELRGAAADVDHEERAQGRVELAGGADEGQVPLLLAAQQLGAHADDVLDGVEERLPVGRVAGGGGRGRPQLLDAVGVEHLPVAAQAGQRALDGLVAQATGDRKSTRLNSSHVKISYAV